MATLTLDYTIDQDDLKVLFVHTREAYPRVGFNQWVEIAKADYARYHKRNTDNPERYGTPKTFSQWVNGQTIALTS